MAVSGEHFPSASLYVGDLAPEVNEALLFEIFNAVGPVASIRVCRDATTRASLGYAYVNFHNVVDAERALDSMNFASIANRPCRIMWSQRDPSLRRSGVGNIFVKHLDKSIDHKALYDTFSVFGNILSCKVATDANGESLGYGFVHYETEEAARKAIENVNGMSISGQTVHVAPFKPRAERDSGDLVRFTNVYIKNLPEDFDKEKLEELFGKVGIITSSMLAYDDSGKFRGFAFVNFERPEEASAAVNQYNEVEINGKRLYVNRAMKKRERVQILREEYEKRKAEKEKNWVGCNLYVKNLLDTFDDAKLKEEFEKFGPIASAKVMTDGSGRSRGFGFVCFTAPEDAAKALQEMTSKIYDRKPLYVSYAQRRDVRRQQLEQQYARRKMGQMPPAAMFPTAGPMYVQGPHVARSNSPYFYPPQNMVPNRRWNPQSGPSPQVMGRQPAGPYGYGMPPVNGRGGSSQRPPRGGRGGRGGRTARPRDGPQGGSQMGGPAVMPQLTSQMLANASSQEQKQMIGERLFALIREIEQRRAGKITGMLLEMDNADLLELLESGSALREKVQEAISVLEAHEGTEGDSG